MLLLILILWIIVIYTIGVAVYCLIAPFIQGVHR